MTTSVLVLDGEQRAALAVVRSLGYHGCRVHVCSSVPRSLAGGSRFAASETCVPDPLRDPEAFSAAVSRLARARRAVLVLPVTEAATLALLERNDMPARTMIPTSDLEHFRRASDKSAVLSLAERLGIAVPAQRSVSGNQDAEPPIPAGMFPLVVKPARSIAGPGGDRRKVGVRYASTPAQLDEAMRELGSEAGPFLLQTRIEGPGLGVFVLRWGGRVIASFAHRRIREKPPSGGVSVCCESVAAPPGLLEQSVTLLEALDWNGVAMVEFKHDTVSGRDYLMEINPRFWGSLQLAIDAGVDFPWYLVQAALGLQLPPVQAWRVGVRSRWCWGEVDHLIARLRHSRADLNLPGDAPGLISTALSVLNPWRPGQRSDVFRLSDPMPAIRETIAWVRAL
jgi:predicted ATP-grasp superfamily ATP-dependent carboligase